MKPLYIFALITGILLVLATARLAALDAGGPAHAFVNLPGQEPATIYLPGDRNAFFHVIPPAHRPPAVVLIHGFSADRQSLSSLARRIAQNGYAVLAIDVSGHGANRNPFPGGFGNLDALRPDVRNAVEFVRRYPLVDGSQIVVIGHSMGAGAVLDYASTDPALKGAVMISGGFSLGSGERPRNALFIFAERDPDFIKNTSSAIAAHLAGASQVEMGKVYGDFQQGTAVEAIQVPKVDHVQIVSSPEATETIVKWLDSAFAAPRAGELNLSEPRIRATGLVFVVFLVFLVPLGKISGEIAGSWSDGPEGLGGWWGLAIVGGALLAALPFISMIVPAAFFPMVVGDAQVSWLLAAGLILAVVLILAHVLSWSRLLIRPRATILAAFIAIAVIYVCQVAGTVTFHSLALTPERLFALVVGAVATFPFWLSFEFLLRRGGIVIATARAAAGRAVIIAMIVVGVSLQALPFVLMLILPTLILIYAMVEIFAASAYSSSRNLTLIAIVESVWLTWVIAATSPITFML